MLSISLESRAFESTGKKDRYRNVVDTRERLLYLNHRIYHNFRHWIVLDHVF